MTDSTEYQRPRADDLTQVEEISHSLWAQWAGMMNRVQVLEELLEEATENAQAMQVDARAYDAAHADELPPDPS